MYIDMEREIKSLTRFSSFPMDLAQLPCIPCRLNSTAQNSLPTLFKILFEFDNYYVNYVLLMIRKQISHLIFKTHQLTVQFNFKNFTLKIVTEVSTLKVNLPLEVIFHNNV